jgi:hypothetical protein
LYFSNTEHTMRLIVACSFAPLLIALGIMTMPASGKTPTQAATTSPVGTPLATPTPGPRTSAATGSITDAAVSVVDYDQFPRLIPVPVPSSAARKLFAEGRKGTTVTITGADGLTFSGMVTSNSLFLRSVLMPALRPYRKKLAAMHPVDQINALTLFGHEAFRTWFGRDAFAWGGHIHDLDDPQESGPNYENTFGLDCSGFAALPYELALELGLMDATDPAAVWTARGFEHIARQKGIRDRGGRNGSSNHWRVDTIDMTHLGTVIFKVPKNGRPKDKDLARMQAGDLVMIPGHVGLTVMIHGEPYYLEHGGWVCPPNGALPVPMREAITIFAKKGEITVRRSLPTKSGQQ